MGGGIPFWAYAEYPYPFAYPYTGYRSAGYRDEMPPPCSPAPVQVSTDVPTQPEAAALTSFAEMLSRLPERRPAIDSRATVSADTPATRRARDNRRAAVRGISVQHGGQTWMSDGPAVQWREAEFVMIGERAGLPLFRRSGGDASVIYVPTTPGMIAPFRRVQ
jgi:hypothetical protein